MFRSVLAAAAVASAAAFAPAALPGRVSTRECPLCPLTFTILSLCVSIQNLCFRQVYLNCRQLSKGCCAVENCIVNLSVAVEHGKILSSRRATSRSRHYKEERQGNLRG